MKCNYFHLVTVNLRICAFQPIQTILKICYFVLNSIFLVQFRLYSLVLMLVWALWQGWFGQGRQSRLKRTTLVLPKLEDRRAKNGVLVLGEGQWTLPQARELGALSRGPLRVIPHFLYLDSLSIMRIWAVILEETNPSPSVCPRFLPIHILPSALILPPIPSSFSASPPLKSSNYVTSPKFSDFCRTKDSVHDIFGRPFVKRFAVCYQTVVCPVCPVCDIGVLWPNGWMN